MKALTRKDIRKETSVWMQSLFDNNLRPDAVTRCVERLSEEIFKIESKGPKGTDGKITHSKLKSLFKEIEQEVNMNGGVKDE